MKSSESKVSNPLQGERIADGIYLEESPEEDQIKTLLNQVADLHYGIAQRLSFSLTHGESYKTSSGMMSAARRVQETLQRSIVES